MRRRFLGYTFIMNIAIDARFYGTGHTGLGRYTTNVLKYLPNHLQGQALKVLLRDREYHNFPSGKNIEKIHAEIPHYSLAEQIELPNLLKKIDADLLYTLHFNAPILSSIPKIVTVHDLIKTHFVGSQTTTRAPWLYQLKRYGYNQVIQKTLMQACDIIVPTNTVKNDILANFTSVKPEKIRPIPEAPDDIFRHPKLLSLDLPKEFVLFVGNAYPHKNLELLIRSMRPLSPLPLVIVAKQSTFLKRILAKYEGSNIIVMSDLTDQELVTVYARANVLVTPSLMEGYGLVGLEAMMVGTPVVASNIAVYREVYGDKVSYFDLTNEASLTKTITQTMASKRRLPLNYPRTWNQVSESIAEVINARCLSL